jgi:putative ABC transport system permease protein
MSLFHRILFKLQNLFFRSRKEEELADELRAHVEMQVAAHIAAGMPPETARQQAMRELGGVEQAKEACRDEYHLVWLESLARDVRHGLRGLRKRPGFTSVAVATLALGIGASTAVFSVVETIMLRPLPFPKAQELVNVEFELSRRGNATIGCSVPELDDLRALSHVFSEVSMVFPMDGNLTGVAEPQRVEAMAVSPNYFRLLGVAPALGRTFGAEEASIPGWAQGCVLSHSAWMNYFGGDPAVIGRKIYMDYDTYRVIGVMPAGFRHPGRILSSNVDVWFTGGLRTAPFSSTPDRNYRIIPGVIGRLAPGVAPASAQAMIEHYAARARAGYPKAYVETEKWTPRVTELHAMLVAEIRHVLWLLLSAVLLVLLICCATVANVTLVRAMNRRQEMAMRCALGASRRALIRQLFIEGLLLAVAGGVGGLIIAWTLAPALLAFAPVSIPLLNQVTLNGRVLGFTVLVSSATCLIFGLAPALRATLLDLVSDLKSGGRAAGSSADTQRWRTILVVAQIALSLMLLVGAGLLFRSFLNVWQTRSGMDPHQVLVGRIWLPPPSESSANRTYLDHTNRAVLMRELVRRFNALPGVQAAAIGNDVPLTESGQGEHITVRTSQSDLTEAMAATSLITPDYFRTLGIPLLRGRAFTDADDGRNPVVMVNLALANRYWPGEDAVGRQLARGQGKDLKWCTVVGVVANTKAEGLDRPDRPRIYVPEYQDSWLALAFFLRANDAIAEPLIAAVRREIHAADPDLPAYGLTTMEQIMARSMARRRFLAVIIGAFAGISLLLAAMGTYGVIALTVSHRTKEIGVRIALGASRRQITGMVLRHGLIVSGVGAGIGTVGAWFATHALQDLLYHTHPLDPVIWTSIVGLLLAITTLACWIPARQASSVDPMVALRAD